MSPTSVHMSPWHHDCQLTLKKDCCALNGTTYSWDYGQFPWHINWHITTHPTSIQATRYVEYGASCSSSSFRRQTLMSTFLGRSIVDTNANWTQKWHWYVLPLLKLTARPWKLMIGRLLDPFGMPSFSGAMVVLGRVMSWMIDSMWKKHLLPWFPSCKNRLQYHLPCPNAQCHGTELERAWKCRK